MYYRVKLKYYPVTIDMDWVAEMCSQYETKCEVPPGCDNIAVAPYGTNFSLIFVCEEHESAIHSMPNPGKLELEIADYMRGLLLRKSYVHLNNTSGFALEQQVRDYQASVKAANKRADARARLEVKEIQQKLEEMGLKVGDPDEELRTGRMRNFERTQKGQPARGTNYVSPVISPVASNDLICELF